MRSGDGRTQSIIPDVRQYAFVRRRGLNRTIETQMTSESTQKVTALSEADQKRLRDQRAVIRNFLPDDRSRQNYKEAAGKLGIIRAILDRILFKPTPTYDLQCIGIVLGDAFVQNLKMEWVMVEDEHGRDPAA